MDLQLASSPSREEAASNVGNEAHGSILRPKCYCTAMDQRARFMHAGFKNVPCDGSMCATRRAEAETAAALH